MARIDHAQRLIDCKIVYFGPSGSGKTANLVYVWNQTKSPEASWMRLDSPNQANVQYYDYLPIKLGDIRGYQTRFHLFTVPGGAAYSQARRKLLEAVDGIVFVADSRSQRSAENAASLSELAQSLAHNGFALAKLPFVIQCNMSDVPDAVSPATVAAPLVGWQPNLAGIPIFPSSAPSGIGVFDTLKAIAKLVLTELKK